MPVTVWREAPRARIEFRDGSWWHEDPEDPRYVGPLGYVECPSSHWAWFRHYVLLGLINGYKLRECVRWAYAHRVHEAQVESHQVHEDLEVTRP